MSLQVCHILELRLGMVAQSISERDSPILVVILWTANGPKYSQQLLSIEGKKEMPSVPVKCLEVSHGYVQCGNCMREVTISHFKVF